MKYLTLKRHPFKPGKLWVVWEPFEFSIPGAGKYTVPVGFQTDLASIPAPFRWIWPPHGHYAEAAAAHDYLYTQKIRKEVADLAFLILMRDYGVPDWKANLFHWAVCRFGNPKRSQQEFKRRGGLLRIYNNYDQVDMRARKLGAA